jgi:hypothetical protein
MREQNWRALEIYPILWTSLSYDIFMFLKKLDVKNQPVVSDTCKPGPLQIDEEQNCGSSLIMDIVRDMHER